MRKEESCARNLRVRRFGLFKKGIEVMKSLSTKSLSVFGCVMLSLSFFHGQTSEQREAAPTAGTLVLSHAEYLDRVQAVWTAQMIAQRTGGRFEHQPASTLQITPLSPLPGYAPVDDDYYYEMVAIRAFEKYGIGLTVQQLGQQWLENNAGSWGSSEQALLLLKRGIKAPDTGHPRYNKLWWTIGPQFSSDVYGVLNPGMPNAAAEMARRFGHINGYAEGTDGAVFVAGMISIAFVEKDTHAIVRKAAKLIHPDSPYRKCLDMVIEWRFRGNQRLVRRRRLSKDDSTCRPCGGLRRYRLQCSQFRIRSCGDAWDEGFAARISVRAERSNLRQRNGPSSAVASGR